MESQLFETSPRDPIALTAAAVLLGTVCVAAVALSALRATKLEPASVLQETD